MTNEMKYVANQLTEDGLDEIQRVLLAYNLGQHVALSGPPGVGKTDLVVSLPSLIRKPFFEITCDAYMTEAPLTGFPELEGDNGSTVTVWKNGEATKALEHGGIFYGDEFDQLPGSVQKRLDSIFDDRQRITRRDGTMILSESAKDFADVVKAYEDDGCQVKTVGGNKMVVRKLPSGKERIEARIGNRGFMGIVSYNPSDKLSKKELEDAVADRFVHLEFGYLPSKLEACLALGDHSTIDADYLEERGVYLKDDELTFLKKDGRSWKNFFDDNKVFAPKSKKIISYQTFVGERDDLTQVPTHFDDRTNLAYGLALFFNTVRCFSEQGTTQIPDAVKHYLQNIGEVNQVALHKPSLRILKAAIKQYDKLTEMGMPNVQKKQFTTKLCIDQICYGKYGASQLGETSVREAVTSMAQFYDLIARPEQATGFTNP